MEFSLVVCLRSDDLHVQLDRSHWAAGFPHQKNEPRGCYDRRLF